MAQLSLAAALAALALLTTHAAAIKVCNPDTAPYNAAGDGKTLDTVAINAAAQACSQGGQLTFTPGKSYLSGPIVVNGTGVVVNVPAGVTLLQSNLVRFAPIFEPVLVMMPRRATVGLHIVRLRPQCMPMQQPLIIFCAA